MARYPKTACVINKETGETIKMSASHNVYVRFEHSGVVVTGLSSNMTYDVEWVYCLSANDYLELKDWYEVN